MELTITIPTMNSTKTLSLVLNSLVIQRINIDFKVLIFDNGSTDGTVEMVNAIIKNNYYKMDIRLIETTERSGGRTFNIPFMRYKICQEVDTEYLFFLDSDVILPPNAVLDLLESFKKRNDLGMLSIRYEPNADHVQMGATLWKTEIAKKIKWIIDENCECKNAIKSLLELGLKAEYHNTLQARHLRYL
jgi:glycosyltransferase involved in cell wall biosynthesis